MSIKEIAKKATTNNGCPLMDGRDHVGTECVIDKVVHMDGVWIINGDDGEYAVYTVAEFPDKFLFGGHVITEMVNELLEQYTIEELNNELMEEPLAIRLTTKRSKKGRPYTAVEVI